MQYFGTIIREIDRDAGICFWVEEDKQEEERNLLAGQQWIEAELEFKKCDNSGCYKTL